MNTASKDKINMPSCQIVKAVRFCRKVVDYNNSMTMAYQNMYKDQG